MVSVAVAEIGLMSSLLVDTPRHPVAAFADRLHARLDDLVGQPMLSMTPVEKRTTLTSIARAEAKLAGLSCVCSPMPMRPVPARSTPPRPHQGTVPPIPHGARALRG